MSCHGCGQLFLLVCEAAQGWGQAEGHPALQVTSSWRCSAHPKGAFPIDLSSTPQDFSPVLLAQPLNEETRSSLNSALLMKSSKKILSNAASITEGIFVGLAKAGRDGPSSKAAKGQWQKKNTKAEQPWRCSHGLQGLVPSAQDTSPVLLWTMDQHKVKPQAKHSGHEAFLGPN